MEVASWSLADDVTNLTFFDDPTDPDVLALWAIAGALRSLCSRQRRR